MLPQLKRQLCSQVVIFINNCSQNELFYNYIYTVIIYLLLSSVPVYPLT